MVQEPNQAGTEAGQSVPNFSAGLRWLNSVSPQISALGDESVNRLLISMVSIMEDAKVQEPGANMVAWLGTAFQVLKSMSDSGTVDTARIDSLLAENPAAPIDAAVADAAGPNIFDFARSLLAGPAQSEILAQTINVLEESQIFLAQHGELLMGELVQELLDIFENMLQGFELSPELSAWVDQALGLCSTHWETEPVDENLVQSLLDQGQAVKASFQSSTSHFKNVFQVLLQSFSCQPINLRSIEASLFDYEEAFNYLQNADDPSLLELALLTGVVLEKAVQKYDMTPEISSWTTAALQQIIAFLEAGSVTTDLSGLLVQGRDIKQLLKDQHAARNGKDNDHHVPTVAESLETFAVESADTPVAEAVLPLEDSQTAPESEILAPEQVSPEEIGVTEAMTEQVSAPEPEGQVESMSLQADESQDVEVPVELVLVAPEISVVDQPLTVEQLPVAQPGQPSIYQHLLSAYQAEARDIEGIKGALQQLGQIDTAAGLAPEHPWREIFQQLLSSLQCAAKGQAQSLALFAWTCEAMNLGEQWEQNRAFDQVDLFEFSNTGRVLLAEKALQLWQAQTQVVGADISVQLPDEIVEKLKASGQPLRYHEPVVFERAQYDGLLQQLSGLTDQHFAWGQSGTPPKELQSCNQQLFKLTDLLLKMRYVSAAPLLTRAIEVARSLSGSLEKQVRIQVTGSELQLDQTVLAWLPQVIEQAVTLAVQFSLETPYERVKHYKPLQGMLSICLRYERGAFWVLVRDDGYGVHFIQRRPEISGLLEGIRKTVLEHGGVLEQGSGQDKKGLRLYIGIPSPLRVFEGRMLRVGGTGYAVPNHQIVSIVSPKAEDIFVNGKGNAALRHGAELVPLAKGPWPGAQANIENIGAAQILLFKRFGALRGVVIDQAGEVAVLSAIQPAQAQRAVVAALPDGRLVQVIELSELE